jgi:hypothetical protein
LQAMGIRIFPYTSHFLGNIMRYQKFPNHMIVQQLGHWKHPAQMVSNGNLATKHIVISSWVWMVATNNKYISI